MAAGVVVSVLTKIPWDKIVMAVPVVVEGVKKLNDIVKGYLHNKSELSASGSKEIKVSDLDERITNIELFEKEQSELIVQIGTQLENVTSALQIVSKRVNYFLVLSAFAFVLGITSLILILIK